MLVGVGEGGGVGGWWWQAMQHRYFSGVSIPVPGTGILRVRQKYVPGASLNNGDGEPCGDD